MSTCIWNTGVTVARALGPLVLTTLLVGWGTPGWLLLGAATLAASYAMGPAVRWATDSRTTSPTVRRPVAVD